MTVQVAATVDGINPLKDGGMSIRFHTQEMPDASKLILLNSLDKFGWLLFKPEEAPFDQHEVPKYDPQKWDEIKSPSQRMRAALFVLWQHTGSQGDFDSFYKKNMETFINVIKSKLEL